MRGFNALCIALLLAGCSSPPEPPAVNWKQSGEDLNTAIPAWHESTGVVHAPVVTGHWLHTFTYTGSEQAMTPGGWFAIAHSTAITIESPDSATFFAAKIWLQQHGATAVIAWLPPSGGLIPQTRITLKK